MQRSIVCGVDGSPRSRSAARVAAELARALDVRLVLAHAAEDRPTFPYGDGWLAEIQRRRAVEAGEALLRQVADDLPVAMPDLRVVIAAPVEGLSELARDEAAELLVVGSRGRGPLAAALLGSVSAQLASLAACPVLVVPAPDAADRFLGRGASGGSILCGVDGSPESDGALEVAGSLAGRLALELLPVYVDDGTWDAASARDGRVRVEQGEPADALAWRALGDDGRLIVVGSRGRGALHAAVLGSVSRAVAATAPLPVVVVPPDAVPTDRADAAAGALPRLLAGS